MTDELIEVYDEDGGGSSNIGRDWKGMVSALAVILVICSIIGTTIAIFTPVRSSGPHDDNIDLQALKFADQQFIEKSWWISKDEIVYHVPRKGANIYNSVTQNVTRVADALFTANSLSESSVDYSTDVRYVAKMIANEEALRNPDRIQFSVIIYDQINGLKYEVGLSPTGNEINAFQWSHGSSYSFVYQDNVYFVSSPEKKAIMVTNTDEAGVIHGLWDWVHQEEIYSNTPGAMWFSASDKLLAYASHPTKASKEITITTYDKSYPYNYEYRMEYPKTGEKHIAIYSISIWNVETKKSITMDVQLRDSTAFHYLFGVSWVTLHGKELLLATWANRWQNETSLTICSYEKATCSLLYEHKYDESKWATPEDYQSIVHSNSSIFFILPKWKRGNAWQHVARINIGKDFKLSSISFIPSGDYDIRRVIEYREKDNVIVYEAQAPHPWERHAYAAPAGEHSILSNHRCISCVYHNCTYQKNPSLSPGEDYKIDFSCIGPGQPYQAMVTLNASLHPQEIRIITEPSAKTLKVPTWKTDTIQLSSGYEAIVQIYEGDMKLQSVPLILSVYGGPDSNQVEDKFNTNPRPIGYNHSAIVHIDVRGSGGRGWKYRSAVYGRLGTVEVEDTLEALKIILAKYPRFDKRRVAVFGWSYGGTMATRLVEIAPQAFFKCAIAVAPVTNFLYYDATYTERFMGDAPRSDYVDLNTDVTKFAFTRLLLLHGLRDDNVHFQNSALLIQSLQQANIPFDLMVYPNEAHSLSRALHHVNHLFESFLHSCFFH